MRLVKFAVIAALYLLSMATIAFASTSDDTRAGARIVGTLIGVDVTGPDDAGVMQSTPTFALGQPLTLEWDAVNNEVDAAVERYEMRIDTNPPIMVSPVGRATYSSAMPQPQLTIGAHVVGVRACSATQCGGESGLAFNIARPVPGTVPNLRIVPTPAVAISLPRAIEYVNAWALWAVDRQPTEDELRWLASRHGNVPITKQSVAAVLEAAYSELAR